MWHRPGSMAHYQIESYGNSPFIKTFPANSWILKWQIIMIYWERTPLSLLYDTLMTLEDQVYNIGFLVKCDMGTREIRVYIFAGVQLFAIFFLFFFFFFYFIITLSFFAEIQQYAIVNHTRISASAMATLVYHLVACKHRIGVPKHLRISRGKQDVISLGR